MKHRIFAWLFLGVAVVGAGAVSGDASEVVEIRLRGRYFMEPATVHITVAVEPDAANRVLRIEADGDSVFRASDVSLSGAGEKRMHAVEFKNLPAGTYTLRAQVFSTERLRGRAEQELVVTGIGGR
ncbi:MAG: hypothetical protein FJW14_16100 [Acidimicrobiia bacterium]|nr:hypothetical protein [Acidimicrobiia bacterium]